MPRKATVSTLLIELHARLATMQRGVGLIALSGLDLDERNCLEDIYTGLAHHQNEIARVLDRQNFPVETLSHNTALAQRLLKDSLTDGR